MKSLKLAAGFLLLGCAVYLFVIRGMQFIYTDSESMLPTVNPGERVVVLGVSGGMPERSDIVYFRFEENGAEYHIKRAAGLPGDTVEIRNRKFYLNGEPRDEPYLYEERIVYEYGPETVPENHIFVLGDNRNNSYDSTEWGFLPLENVMGKAVMIYWPYINILE